MILLTLGLILISIIIYKSIFQPRRFWEQHGAPYPDSWIRCLYLNWFVMFKRQSAAYMVQDLYDAVPNSKVHGLYQFNSPVLIIKDPDLIKQIMIKDFDHFTDRKFTFSSADEPVFGKNLLNLKGQKWRDMRAILSPSFTANKMKALFQIIDTCGKRFVKHFLDQKKNLIEVEMQDCLSRFTNDVIASSVFGAEVDSFNEPENEFYLRGRQTTDITTFPKNLKFLCGFLFPKLYNFLRLQLLPDDANEFFINLVKQTIKLREEGKIVRIDMIHLLMEAKKEYDPEHEKEEVKDKKSKTNITEEDIISQAFIFFFAGFESVSRTMCFISHEMAENGDVQEKLRQEIAEVNKKYDSTLTYDILNGMKYLDMIVSEVLRKYAIQIATDRVCTKDFELDTGDGKMIYIPAGTAITIPTFSMHRDPQYFPNPDKFDPERFSDENKTSIPPYVYQPFGLGPRMCIGSRFALIETKLLFFYLLSNFEIVPIDRTKIPLVLKKSLMTLSSEYGFWLGLKRIKTE